MKLTQGYHITQSERKAINFMIENRYATAHNQNRTKTYEIIRGCRIDKGMEYEIRIGTRERKTIGADVTTEYRRVTIEVNKP